MEILRLLILLPTTQAKFFHISNSLYKKMYKKPESSRGKKTEAPLCNDSNTCGSSSIIGSNLEKREGL